MVRPSSMRTMRPTKPCAAACPRATAERPRAARLTHRERQTCVTQSASPRAAACSTHAQRQACVTHSSGLNLQKNQRMPVPTSERRGLASSHRHRRTNRHVRVPTLARRHLQPRVLPVRGGSGHQQPVREQNSAQTRKTPQGHRQKGGRSPPAVHRNRKRMRAR